MHLHDLMGWPGPMTHRQYLAWQVWQRMDIEQPQRAEVLYSMQEAQAAGGYRTSLQDHALEIVVEDEGERTNTKPNKTPQQRAAAMKSIVSAATGSKWN